MARRVSRKHHRSRKHRHGKHHSGGKKSGKQPAGKKPSGAGSSSFSDAVPADLSAVAFQGQQGPGIASWFSSDSKRDSTNGHSWRVVVS